MKLLLDTHCLIWALADSPALTPAGRRAILAAEEVWFSEASLRETGLKWRRGKLGIAPRRLVDQALKDGFRMLAIGLEPILMSCELRQAHADPFDRLLYAQARHHGYALLTIDRKLSAFGARIHRP
jgi:PIN domain nuclease of toxin-antitoxin system